MSDYFRKLSEVDPEVANRYVQKIGVINNVDPFALVEKDFTSDPQKFPPMTNMDIVTYLVLTTSFYSKDQMKAHKSLSAFKYFDAGFVSGCGAHQTGDYIVVAGKIKHSQKMNLPPLRAWAVCQTDGSIVTAHCTCMAGLGEVCSHVGALLYAVEYIVTVQSSTSCTDIKAMWPVPSVSKVEYKSLKEISFGHVIPSFPKSNQKELSLEEIQKALRDLEEAGCDPALMTVVEPYASKIGAGIEESSLILSNPYQLLYNDVYETYSLDELQFLSHSTEISLSQEDCDQIKLNTADQSKYNEWYIHRAGRITASNFERCVKTSLSKPSLSLIKQICYPVNNQFKTKATEWGLSKEKTALKLYTEEQRISHKNLHVEAVGLCIKPEMPYFGASPESMVSCDCCHLGCVEVKCPYTVKNLSLEEFCKTKGSCLVLTDEGEILLNKTHSYYYQVQQQMAISNTYYCDFVVWSPKELFIERITFNEEFWISESQESLNFHKNVIMPEFLGKYFTTARTTSAFKYCICQSVDDGRPMIMCAEENCIILWYHMDCIGMKTVPETFWYCPNCMAQRKDT